MSGPGFTNDGAVLAAVNTAFRAACGGGLRQVLTAPARGAQPGLLPSYAVSR